MAKPRLILIGCGTVGQGLLEIIQEKKTDISIVAISDFTKGSINCTDGLHIEKVLDLLNEGKSLEEYSCDPGDCGCTLNKGWDALKTIQECDADIMAEMTYTDIKTGQPATTHIEEALKKGMSVTTSNKGPAALYYKKLAKLAEENGVKFLIEGTVMSGTPVFNLARECLAGCKITEVKGILNGTTNYILTKMEQEGWSYEDALKKAQELGYAEADPTFDVEGIDAAHKLTILASLAFGIELQFDKAYTEGISGITTEDVNYAEELGYRIKDLGITRKTEKGIELRVHPTLIPEKRLIANVDGVMNAVLVQGDAVGPTLYYGAGAGAEPTASAVVADIIDTVRTIDAPLHHKVPLLGFQSNAMRDTPILAIEDIESAYYLRMQAEDHPGVLADVSEVFSKNSISIEAVIQKEPASGESSVHLIMLTQKCVEANVNQAIQAVESLASVQGKVVRIRMEHLD